MKTKLIAGLVVLALVATAIGLVVARNNFGMQSPAGALQWSKGPDCMSHLTEEQRQAMHQQMQTFRQQLAEQYGIDLTDEERQAMQEQLQEKQQELHQEMQEFRQQLAEQYGIDLTDEERQAMQEQMHEFRQELFAQYNITCPSGPQFVDGDGNGVCDNLGTHMQGFRRGPGFFGGGIAIIPDLEEKRGYSRH